MNFSANDVATLRGDTGAGIMDCKKALTECNGDMAKATVWLREQGVLKAAKKESRIASNGIVDSYIHMGGKIGVLIEVNCETDFVARGIAFQELVHDIAMHIAAVNPKYVRMEDVDQTELEKEKIIYLRQAINEGKKPEIAERMAEGKIKKYLQEICLLEQPFVKNPDVTINELVTEAVRTIGEKISVRRFIRYECGEGIQKREEDFAAEVAKQMESK